MAIIKAGTITPVQALSGEDAELLLGEDLRSRLRTLAARIETYAERISKMPAPTNDQEAGQINDLLAVAKVAYEEMEAERSKRTRPLLDEQKSVNGMFAPAKDAFKSLEAAAKKHVGAYIVEKQTREAIEQEEARQRLSAAEDKKVEALAAALNEGGDTEALSVAQQEHLTAAQDVANATKTKGLESNFGKSTVRFKVEVSITDVTKIPREYLEAALAGNLDPLRSVLRKAYREGTYSVPGAEIHEEPIVATRPGMR